MYKIAAVCLLLCASAFGQSKETAKAAEVPSAALMQKIIAAWNTDDPANAARFYDKSSDDVFFDITPLEYRGWAAYEAGVKQQFAGFENLKFKLNNDEKVHHAGSTAWATATWEADGKMKNGNKVSLEGRWTVIWEKKAGKWLIVHEHFSAPWIPPSEMRQR